MSSADRRIFEPRNPDYGARVRDSFSRQAFMRALGAELVEVRPGFVEIHLAYRDDLCQQHGYFHGGVIGTLADNAGGYSAFSLFDAGASVITVEYKVNFLAPGQGERLVARGQVVRTGRTLTVCESQVIAVRNDNESLCATAAVTLMALHGRTDHPS